MNKYFARDIRVIDGDTIEATLDLGFRISIREKFRLLAVDTHEMRDRNPIRRKFAETEKLALEQMLTVDHDEKVIIETEKPGKYGRWRHIRQYESIAKGEE